MPGMKRIQILTALMAALFGGALMVATPARADTIRVTVTADGIDSAPGNGTCAGPNGCTLRAAIMEANGWPGTDTIVLGAGTYGLTRAGNDDTAVNGDLDITSPSLSTARNMNILLPPIFTIISSKCHTRSAGLRRLRMFAAIAGPNLSAQHRMVS